MTRKIILLAVSWLLACTSRGADKFPSVYDQTIKDDVDHLIIRVEKQNGDRERSDFGTTNIVVVPLSGPWQNDTVHIPFNMIPVKDRDQLEPGNVIHVQNRTNFTIIAKDKYPPLRKISAVDDYYVTDDEYIVTLISVCTDSDTVGPNAGKKYPRATISLERRKDKATFDGIPLGDFEYKDSVHEGDVVRLVSGATQVYVVKHKLYPWEKKTALSVERLNLPK